MKENSLAHHLAMQAVSALIFEVSLSPKPGLVDRWSSNAHDDMDWQLLVLSAESLYPTFYQIAHRAFNASIGQALREDIAEIGRQGEEVMLAVTQGVNTHRGAIWILGLFIAVLASHRCTLTFVELLEEVALLASFPDERYRSKVLTNGVIAKQRYGIRGALEEAQAGFPSLSSVIAMPTRWRNEQRSELYWLERLLQLISVVEDSCIVSRSDLATLHNVQNRAIKILTLGLDQPAGLSSYADFCHYCCDYSLSPGGSADLLAAIIFLEKLGVIDGTVAF
ncbi:triphosphoribosyl-dephospho-CoA synthase [Ignatzschineria sp. F8392]|uniref:triphosphoribosyl-dephospho-CoA synthase n=1 Tax=Ignatzschineria sp. F8392 TaxID=1980117 RepID=UPI00130320D5|nr:triphosphoribosyl-dephospho-CoA synthase [Ignatzschineria sp. F8392]